MHREQRPHTSNSYDFLGGYVPILRHQYSSAGTKIEKVLRLEMTNIQRLIWSLMP